MNFSVDGREMRFYCSLTLLFSTVLSKPVQTTRGDADHIPTEWITDRVTHDVISFDTVYTNRNLRGLYPIDERDEEEEEEEDEDDSNDRENSTVEIVAVGQGGQIAYIANIVGDRLHVR